MRGKSAERGGPISHIGFYRLIQRVGEAAKMPFPIHPHMLRHACGFKLANDGHDTRALQHYLTGIFVCARAASGRRSAGIAAAPPSSVMNARRHTSDIRLPPTRLGPPPVRLPRAQPAIAQAGRAEQSLFRTAIGMTSATHAARRVIKMHAPWPAPSGLWM